jgi:hypothetical protein
MKKIPAYPRDCWENQMKYQAEKHLENCNLQYGIIISLDSPKAASYQVLTS